LQPRSVRIHLQQQLHLVDIGAARLSRAAAEKGVHHAAELAVGPAAHIAVHAVLCVGSHRTGLWSQRGQVRASETLEPRGESLVGDGRSGALHGLKPRRQSLVGRKLRGRALQHAQAAGEVVVGHCWSR